jgi:hypothetical protein
MSCNSCGNLGSNCSCSDNCPYKTSDITVFDGSFNVLEVPCDASLNDVLALLESYTTNMVAELIDSVTYSLAEGNCLGLVAGEYSFQQIITALIDTVCDVATCPPSVSISNTGPFALLATPAGGLAPYTYQWSIADNLGAMSISGVSTNANVALSFGESFFTFGLAEVTITDSLGCVASNTFLYGVAPGV